MDSAFALYSAMGVKGFKIDFFDRDDQLLVRSTYDIAKKAAEYKLMVDYHGIYKPTGLQRTYPNVIGYEGVKGLENFKWANEDQPHYTVTIPFIRMMAGPMDYTPGAFRNATQEYSGPLMITLWRREHDATSLLNMLCFMRPYKCFLIIQPLT